MSNYWNGEGVPENGQKFRVVSCTIYTFIGVATNRAVWVCESPRGTIMSIDAEHCKPIKSPEEVALDKFIKKALSYDCDPEVVMVSRTGFCGFLYDAGYRKVVPMSLDEYKSMHDSGEPMANDYKWLVDNGHVIEKKEKGE